MTPNYEFIGINATRLYYQLEQLRTSAEFRAMEDAVAARYEQVVVVAVDGAVPYKTLGGTDFPEATTAADGVRYIYIDTSTAAVKMEDGVWKSMSIDQVFTHAMSHAASDLPSTPFGNVSTGTAGEIEAINRTNIVTQEAGLAGPANTGGVQFIPNGSAGYPEALFSDGTPTIHIQEWLNFRPASDVIFGRPTNRIEQEFDENGDISKVTGYNDADGSKGVIDIDSKGEQSWSQKETVFDAQDNVRSVDTYNDDGSRTASGFDETGFEIWQYQQSSDGLVWNVRALVDWIASQPAGRVAIRVMRDHALPFVGSILKPDHVIHMPVLLDQRGERMRYKRDAIEDAAKALGREVTHHEHLVMDMIDAAAEVPELTVRFALGDGDAVIFDNQRTLHSRTPFRDEERHLLKTTMVH